MLLDIPHEVVFNQLPMDSVSFPKVQQNPIPDEALRAIRTIFQKHAVDHELGLALTHRHFALQPGEQLVEYENVATPWLTSTLNPVLKSRLVPKTWSYVDGELYAYEFSFVATGPSNSRAYDFKPEFLDEFKKALVRYGLGETFGLARFPDTGPCDGVPMVEFTVGRANITVPVSDGMEGAGAFHPGATWMFPCIWDQSIDGDGKPTMRWCGREGPAQ